MRYVLLSLFWMYTGWALTGTVSDQDGRPVTGVITLLESSGAADTTGIDGAYDIPSTGINDLKTGSGKVRFILTGNTIRLHLDRTERIRISIHNLYGTELTLVRDGILPAGNHMVSLPERSAVSGIGLVRVRTGDNESVLKTVPGILAGAGNGMPSTTAKSAGAADTLTVSCRGCSPQRLSVADPNAVFNVTLQCTTAWQWARGIHGPSIEDEIDAVASDADGNVYATGKFEDTITIDGWDTPLPSHGKADIMVVKYTVTGHVAWVRHFGGPGEDNIFDAACDGDGNLIMNGWFEDTVIFDDDTLVSEGFNDVCVVKIDPTGDVVWALRCGGTAPAGGNEVSIGPDNQIIVCADSKGAFRAGDFSYDPGLSIYSDSYVMSVSPDGIVEWVGAVGGSGMCRAKALNVGPAGDVYLGGDFMGEVIVSYDVDPETLAYDTADSLNAYMTSWTADGTLRWVKSWGGTGSDLCKGVAINAHHEVYLVGQFDNTAAFDGDTLYGTGRDLFVWQVDTLGTTNWLRHVTAPQNLAGAEVELDDEGRLIFGTGLSNAAYFGSAGGTVDTVAPPGSALLWPVMVRYDRTGTLDFTAFADGSAYGRLGETSRSGNRVYFDVAYNMGPHTFGLDQLYSDGRNNKDAGIAAIAIHE